MHIIDGPNTFPLNSSQHRRYYSLRDECLKTMWISASNGVPAHFECPFSSDTVAMRSLTVVHVHIVQPWAESGDRSFKLSST